MTHKKLQLSVKTLNTKITATLECTNFLQEVKYFLWVYILKKQQQPNINKDMKLTLSVTS